MSHEATCTNRPHSTPANGAWNDARCSLEHRDIPIPCRLVLQHLRYAFAFEDRICPVGSEVELTAMRHFAESLRAHGISVDYVRLDDRGNTGSLTGELGRALSRHAVDRIVATEPGKWRVWEMMQTWDAAFGLPVEIRPDDRFLCSRTEFAEWARGRRSLRMEYFYRHMRRKTGWLMGDDQPQGGQ